MAGGRAEPSNDLPLYSTARSDQRFPHYNAAHSTSAPRPAETPGGHRPRHLWRDPVGATGSAL